MQMYFLLIGFSLIFLFQILLQLGANFNETVLKNYIQLLRKTTLASIG